jgi:hypothetical protein
MPICKELVERDLDRTLSTYTKYRELSEAVSTQLQYGNLVKP